MSLPPSTPSTSTAGIATTPTGDRVVAASRRADGSIRKELKIRPGYTPDEDVKRYRAARTGEAATRAAARAAAASTTTTPAPKTPRPLFGNALEGIKKDVVGPREVGKKVERPPTVVRAPLLMQRALEGIGKPPPVAMGGRKKTTTMVEKKKVEEVVPDSWDEEEEKVVAKPKETTKEVEKEEEKDKPTLTPTPANAPSTLSDAVPPTTTAEVEALRTKLREAEALRARQKSGLYIPPAERKKLLQIVDLEKELEGLSLGTKVEEEVVEEKVVEKKE